MPFAARAETTAAGRPKSAKVGMESPPVSEMGSEMGMETDKVEAPKVEWSSCPARVTSRGARYDEKEAAKGRTDDAAEDQSTGRTRFARITRRASPISRRSGSVRLCRRRGDAPTESS